MARTISPHLGRETAEQPGWDAEAIPLPQGVISLEAFLRLPEAKPAFEYAEGKVSQKAPPQGQHSVLQLSLASIFSTAGRTKKVALAFTALRVTWGRRSYVPDVAVYRWERVPRTPNGEIANRFTAPPDLAVEIISPEQRVAELVDKCLWYVGNGVRVALLVDADDRSVTVFQPGMSPVTLRGADLMEVEDVLPDLRLTVDELFACLRLD